MGYRATLDTSALQRNALRLGRLASNVRERVVTRTMGTLRRKILTEARRAIAQEFGVGVQAIGQRMTSETSADSLSIYGTTGRLPLHEFSGRYTGPKSPGAAAEIVRGSRKVYTAAFAIKGRSPAVIYARPLVDSTRRAPRRYVRLHGPSVESMFLGRDGGEQTPAAKVTAMAGEIFGAEIERLLTVEGSN